MRPLHVCLLLGCCLAVSLNAQVVSPEILDESQLNEIPFKYNGKLEVGNAVGSASSVANGVIATAAHVIFDDEDFAWEPINLVRYFPRNHRFSVFQPAGPNFPVAGFVRWTSYATRVENDDSGPGLSTPDTFNLDFAAGYISESFKGSTITEYPEVYVDQEDSVSILRDDRTKMIVGYPADGDFIDPADRGLMHRTPPGDYYCEWEGITDLAFTWRDSEDFWFAIYYVEDVNTYGGNSGGPIYVLDDEGEWVMAGVLVGSRGSDTVLVRGIDEEAWKLIEEADALRNVGTLGRVESLDGRRSGVESVVLRWDDLNEGEAAYDVFRFDNGTWDRIASLDPDTEIYRDMTVSTEKFYKYQVQAVGPDGSRPPKSLPVGIDSTTGNRVVADHFGESWLQFRNVGDSNWHFDGGNRLRAGVTRALGSSGLALDIIGPGTLSFAWSVSSERNVDYNNPGSPNYREIYDAIFLYLNGERVTEGSEFLHLSGSAGPDFNNLQIPEGYHTVLWNYEKDPYTTDGEDTAYIDSIAWNPDPVNGYPVIGAYGIDGAFWNESNWFGSHSGANLPITLHQELGWMHLVADGQSGLYLHSYTPGLGNIHTSPRTFPFVYDYDRETWLYYIPESGAFGRGAQFRVVATGEMLTAQ